ncbi:hypothetical protein BJY01DRAFT_254023 [Aspergillus pseudoustus]|uniref:Metallo-beta-lactamase domain-containing protein n=1 Tax=Aspergillus pseudoustus TaxID=1810923 RepID=A0ABR4IWR9_9EURO
MQTSLEWFGATTFRLKTHGLTIFLDTWLDRPANIPSYGCIDQVEECDYIFISHAHFDHLPGADRIAKKTGAIIYANCEAINVMRLAGVPEQQLFPVQGGERVPLYTRDQRALPEAERPAPACSVHIWPSLHCFGPPGEHRHFPDVIDTATEYHGQAGPYACTLDITQGQRLGLFRAANAPAEHLANLPAELRGFVDYIRDQERNRCSPVDGGQLMFNFLLGQRTLLWMAHLGGYEGVLRDMRPQPDTVIMACAGRANFNGRPWNGSAAQFATQVLKWLGEPPTVIWCLHDESPIPPRRIEVQGASDMVQREMKTRVMTLNHVTPVSLWE